MVRTSKRKFLIRCATTLTATAMALAGRHAGAASTRQVNDTELVYVGTQGSQLHALRFDPASGALETIGVVADGPRSTWTVIHPSLPILYVVDDDNSREGSVIAYAVDRESGALTKIGKAPAGGNGTTYLWLDTPSMTLLAANFGGGPTIGGGTVSSLALGPDGRPGQLVSTIGATGSGPHRRQTKPHAHSVAIDPSGRFALVPDLGADRVFVYGFDRATHALTPDDQAHPRSFVAPPGSGPRHLAFGADGRFVYLLTELTAQLMTLRWDAQQGRLASVQTLATNSAGFKGQSSGAEIAVGIDGRHVYVANRAENALLVYRVNADNGELTFVQRMPSGGEVPWAFALHASGRWMLVANQRSGSVNVFAIDPASGMLTSAGKGVAVPTPVNLTLLP